MAAALAYNPAIRTVVLFGGQAAAADGGAFLADTWLWNGTRWSQAHPPVSPPPRMSAGMGYDAATRSLVLFGGEGNIPPGIGFLADTWTWDGATWTELHPETSPTARVDASMSSFPPRGTVLLFGGDTGGRVPKLVNELWEWNGRTWALQHPRQSPSPRSGGAMAYDEATSSIVLFGGSNGIQMDDTWTWDGSNWIQQHPSVTPPARYTGVLAYHVHTRRAVLFGGQASMAYLDDTWTWDGLNWRRQTTTVHPDPAGWASLAYDGVSGRLLLFGGFGGGTFIAGVKRGIFPASTWLWDGTAWSRATQ